MTEEIDWITESMTEYFWRWCQGSPLLTKEEVNAFASGWAAHVAYSKDKGTE